MSSVRALAGLVSVLALAAGAPTPGLAHGKTRYRVFDAVETGSSVIQNAGPGALKVTGHAAIHGRLIGNGRLDLHTALTAGDGTAWKAVGTFKITAADGSTLIGTSRGNLTVSGQVNPVKFFSRVTGGTGRFAGARGWLVSVGTATLTSVDATGTVHTRDEATCKGRIRYPAHASRRARH